MLARKLSNASSHGNVKGSQKQVWLISVVVIIFLIWSSFAQLNEIVRGAGQVVPTMSNQIIQNLEGGIIQEIYVTEGDIVDQGDLVLRMDETRFQSAFRELQDQHWALALRLSRLEAEQDLSSDFIPPPYLAEQAPEHAASEMQLFLARRRELQETISNLERSVSLQSEEVDILRAMAERSAVPEIEVIRAEQSLADVISRLEATISEFETTRAQMYSETLTELRQVAEQIRAREDQLSRTNVRSPIRGVVNSVVATTVGGVVQPGDPLLEIISLDDDLRVEGQIDPRDIGFVYVGMPATIKLTAFDFSVYGTLSGTVVHVGADTVTDESQRDARPYYEVYISLDQTSLEGPNGVFPIRPGMQAEIELEAGKKTVLQYILSPLFDASEALTER